MDKTPICHRLAAAYMTGAIANPTSTRGALTAIEDDFGRCLCIGSRCALWIPHGAIPPRDACTATTPPVIDASRGNCADNPFASAWPDPAGAAS